MVGRGVVGRMRIFIMLGEGKVGEMKLGEIKSNEMKLNEMRIIRSKVDG